MKQRLLVAVIGLALVAGCGDGDSIQSGSLTSGATLSDGTAPAPTTTPRLTAGSAVPPQPARTTTPAAGAKSSSASPPTARRSSSGRPEPRRSPAPRAAPTSAPTPSPTRSPTQAQGPLLITEEDNGKTFEISRTASDAVLRLGGGFYSWSSPELDGTSIRLQQRQFVRDPGYSEWEIQPVSSGTTVIRSSGDPKCRDAEPPCGAPSTVFEVRIVVG